MAEGMPRLGGGVKQVRMLKALGVRVGVAQNPAIVWQIGAVAILSHDARADNLHVAGAILEEVERLTRRRALGPAQDMVRVAPGEVRHAAEIVHDMRLPPLRAKREHAREAARTGRSSSPAMQENETLAIGRVKQVIEPVLSAAPIVADARNAHGIPD